MYSVTVKLILLLSCLNQNIYSKPINQDGNGDSKRNNTLLIFLSIVLLFIFVSILYYTKPLWMDALKSHSCCFCCHDTRRKSIISSDIDMDISDHIYKDIDFDSINFTEVAGNSRLSIDINDIMSKYLNVDRVDTSESSNVELNSFTKGNIPKMDSKTRMKLNNIYISPNLEDYNEYYDLSNIHSQEITDIKVPEANIAFIENSSSLINGKFFISIILFFFFF